MPIPKQAPDPGDWLKATLRTQAQMQVDVLAILRKSEADIQRMLRELARRPAQGPASLVRQHQLKLVQRNLRLEMAKIWRKLGDVVQARRLEAAASAIKLGQDLNSYLLGSVAGLDDAERIAANIASAEEEAAKSGMDRLIARAQGQSYVPLSQTVYNSSVAINGTVDRLISSALARNLSAQEMAKEVLSFINPNTPGGARYAALRLARTEINNAAHAVAVHQVQESPWVEGMRWRLSGSHPKTDICNKLADGGPENDGVYPKEEVPAKPHPQCFCTVIPVTASDDDFLDALVGGKYDSYLTKYVDPEDAHKVFAQPPAKPSVRATPAKRAPTKKAAPASLHPKLDKLPKIKPNDAGRTAEIQRDLRVANPKYGSDPAYGVNCVHVANTWELRARGYDVAASRLPRNLLAEGGRSSQEALDLWRLPDGTPHNRLISTRISAQELKRLAEALPEGGRGWVRVSWDHRYGGGGHIFSVEKLNGRVRWIDAQTGRSISIEEYIFKALPDDAFGFARVDDLIPTDGVIQFIE